MEISLIQKPASHKIQSKQLSIIFNPTGVAKSDVVLFDHKQDKLRSGAEQKVFEGAGEYEVNDTMLQGVAVGGGGEGVSSVSYAVTGGGLRVVHLSDASVELSDKQIEQLTPVDVLMIPVGDKSGRPEAISKLISALEPRVIVPIGADDSAITKLAAELGVKPEKTPKFKITSRDLPEDSQKLVVVE